MTETRPTGRPMYWRPCGGCEGLGAHRRWCPVAVGQRAAYFGQLSEEAESLGDRIGPNDMEAANAAWYLAARLRKQAADARDLHQRTRVDEEGLGE